MNIGNPVRTYTVTPVQVPQPELPEKTEVEETRVTEKEKEAA